MKFKKLNSNRIANRCVLVACWMVCWTVSFQVGTTTAQAQYANRYANDYSSKSGATYQVDSASSSKRSGYAHSAAALGSLSSEGYDDLAEFRPQYSEKGSYRKPQSMIELNDQSALICTLNTGEFYLLDLRSGDIKLALTQANRRWSKLLKLESNIVAAVDLAAERVVVFQFVDGQFRQIAELSAPGHPHSLAWQAQNRTLYISGQWSQRLYRYSTDKDITQWQQLASTDLPIHGGTLCHLPKNNALVVVDAFGGDYVVLRDEVSDGHVDTKTIEPMHLVNQSSLTGHNVPCVFALNDEQSIVFPFQLLNPETYSVQGDITWGGLMSNNLRWLNTERLLTMQGDEVIKQGRFIPLGQVGNGAGDPTSMSFGNDERIAVTLGGIDRVAVGKLGQTKFQQFQVGLHPVASVFAADGKQLYVLNEFSDSVTQVDLSTEQTKDLPLGPLRQPTLAERGERLFFHSALAHDGWMSCHSCHSRGHTSGQLNDNTSDGSLGTPKRILSLLGQAETAPYSWTGEVVELEHQVLNSIQSTMATDFQISKQTVDAIAAFVRTLPPPPSLQAARAGGETQHLVGTGQAEGRELFEQLSCVNCHAGNQFTVAGRFDVGIEDQRGQKEFNPPSLIGVSQRSRSLLHDGRATSVRDVIGKYEHQLPRELTEAELNLLVEYLAGL